MFLSYTKSVLVHIQINFDSEKTINKSNRERERERERQEASKTQYL